MAVDNAMETGEEIEVVEKYMRKMGHRWTNQRSLVTRAVFESHDHFSAEELLELCRNIDRDVSRATVYRTLTMLEHAGFVEGLDTGDGGRKFEHVLGHRHHDHMVCNSCGVIIEFFDAELERRQELAAGQHGFTIQSHSLKLFGLCNNCRDRPGEGPAGA